MGLLKQLKEKKQRLNWIPNKTNIRIYYTVVPKGIWTPKSHIMYEFNYIKYKISNQMASVKQIRIELFSEQTFLSFQ